MTERALPLLKVECPGPGERRSGIRGRADDRETMERETVKLSIIALVVVAAVLSLLKCLT